MTRLRFVVTPSDRRRGDGADASELLSVSIHRGVVPRSGETDDLPRADDLASYKVVRVGDVVLNRMRAFQGAVGRSDHDGIVSPDYTVLRPGPGADPRYLHHLLRSRWFVGEMIARLRGIGSTDTGSVRTPRINWEDLGDIDVATRSLAEQRAIADYLDAETARIDALITKKQQLIHLLDERVAALVDLHFSPGETDATVRLARLATVQSGITLNAGNIKSGETVRRPYLRVANVQPGWLNLAEVKEVDVEPAAAARSLLRTGDVLMTEGGDLDKLGRGTAWRDEIPNCLHQNHVFAVRPHAGVLDSDFLANVTRTSHARAYFESTGVQSTNLASTNSFKVADFRVPAIDVTTQRARCASYERLAQPLSEASTKLKQQLGLLAEHRQAIITAAVAGELSVPGVA